MINFSQIQELICYGESIPAEELHVKTRKREIVFTRQLIMYFTKNYTNETWVAIGSHFGQDHATAIHAHKTINNYIGTINNYIDVNKVIKAKVAYYDIKFKEINDFEKNVIIDKIIEIKELLARQINSDLPISYDMVVIYNMLLEKTTK